MVVDKEKVNEIYDLIFKGQIGVMWIAECENNPDIRNLSVEEALKKFKKKHGNINIFNESQLIMMGYLNFVYLREKMVRYDDIIKEINMNMEYFEIKCSNENPDLEYIIRRLRNSISHGNFTVKGGKIIFGDKKVHREGKEADFFEAKVKLVDFGEFIQEFCFKIRDHIYKG